MVWVVYENWLQEDRLGCDFDVMDRAVAVFDSEDAAKVWAKIYIGDNRDVEDNEYQHSWWEADQIPFNPKGTIKEVE